MKLRGFTVIEILVVLVLMALVLGIFITRMSGLGDQKNTETAHGDLRAIQTAINAYYLNHNKVYPAGADWQNNDLVNDSPRVLRQKLYDPFRAASTEYSYFTSSDEKYYVAFSYGPDRAADITGINTSGNLAGTNNDDIFVTNGTAIFGS